MYYIIWNEIFSFFPGRFEMYISVAWFWILYIIMWKCVWCDTVCRLAAHHHILYDWELLFGVRSCAVGVNLCSFYHFFDKVLFHHDNYKCQVYGYDTTLFIGYHHPITAYRTCLLGVRCFGVEFNLCSFVDTRGEVIERFSNKHNLCILNEGTHTYLKPQAQHANKPTSAIDSQFPNQDLLWEVCGRCCRIPMEVTKWLHPKGNHHPQEIKPLVWWRMPGSPEG